MLFSIWGKRTASFSYHSVAEIVSLLQLEYNEGVDSIVHLRSLLECPVLEVTKGNAAPQPEQRSVFPGTEARNLKGLVSTQCNNRGLLGCLSQSLSKVCSTRNHAKCDSFFYLLRFDGLLAYNNSITAVKWVIREWKLRMGNCHLETIRDVGNVYIS